MGHIQKGMYEEALQDAEKGLALSRRDHFFLSIAAFAQSTITGNVRNSNNKDVIPAVSVTVKGGTAGTFTDERGNFKLVTNAKPPFTIIISSVAFETQELEVKSESDVIQVDLKPAASLGVEVVVSASRVP